MFNDLLRNDGIRRGPFGSSLKKDTFVPDTKDAYAVYEQRNAINNSFKTRYFIDQSKYDELHNFHLHTNDIIMSGAGTIGKLAKVPNEFRKGVFNQALIRFRVNDKVNVSYFLTFMNTPKMQKKLTEANPGSAMVNLVPMKELKKWQILIPKLEEQNKIEKLLTQVNNLIALYQRKLDLLKRLKYGMLQKMFADQSDKQPTLRFSDFKDNWKQHKLKDLSKSVYSGLSGKTKNDFGHGNARYITYLNVHDNVIANSHEIDSIEVDTNQNLVQKGDILFTISSETPDEVALNSVWPYELNKPVYLNSFCFGFRPQMQTTNPYFLSYYLRSPMLRTAIYPLAQGISRFNISKNNILKLVILLPKIKEQEQISNGFCVLIKLISLYQSKINTLTTFKKFLLQQIFI